MCHNFGCVQYVRERQTGKTNIRCIKETSSTARCMMYLETGRTLRMPFQTVYLQNSHTYENQSCFFLPTANDTITVCGHMAWEGRCMRSSNVSGSFTSPTPMFATTPTIDTLMYLPLHCYTYSLCTTQQVDFPFPYDH